MTRWHMSLLDTNLSSFLAFFPSFLPSLALFQSILLLVTISSMSLLAIPQFFHDLLSGIYSLAHEATPLL